MKKRWYKRYAIPEKWRPYVFNRYVFTAFGFLFWLTFLDQHDFILQKNYRKKLNELRKEHNYYVTEIEKNKKTMTELFTNTKNLEKFAREKYYMKKSDEDIFVFVDENNKLISLKGNILDNY